MNQKIIIQDLNRKRVPFCELKKILFIDDDMKLVDTLIKTIDIGINSLQPAIIRDQFRYIIYSLQYLKILNNQHPDIVDKINMNMYCWEKKIEKILNTKNIKGNEPYYSFVKEILEEMKFFVINTKKEENNDEKELTFEEMIYQIIEKPNDINIDKLDDILNKCIQKYISMDRENVQWNKIGQIIYYLQAKLINAKDSIEEQIIGKIIEVLDTRYSEYHNLVTEKNIQLFQEYIDNNYSEKKDIFNLWNIERTIKEPQPFIITIDEPYSLDLDDALAVSQDKYGLILHVYIANTTPFLLSNPSYDPIALERYSSLYFQRQDFQKVFHMLPDDCAENLLSLRENEIRSVVDHTYYLDCFGNISYDISYKNIIVNKRLSYSEVDELLKDKNSSGINEYLKTIEKCIQEIYKKLSLNKKYKFMDESRSQKMVSSAAILTNYMIAKEAIKNQYLLLYQDYFTSKYSVIPPENVYAKVTSPIRRYSDLKNNYLLNRFLEDNISDVEYSAIEKELHDMIPKLEERKERNKQFSKIGTLHLKRKI